MAATDWQPGRWWRVLAPDGSLWCETSSESEARAAVRKGDRLKRSYGAEVTLWRDAAAGPPPEALVLIEREEVEMILAWADADQMRDGDDDEWRQFTPAEQKLREELQALLSG